MIPSDVYRLYEQILASQQAPDGVPFKFIFDKSITLTLVTSECSRKTNSCYSATRSKVNGPALAHDETPPDNSGEGQNDSGEKRKLDGDDQGEENRIAKKGRDRTLLALTPPSVV
jgi:hypothetical protein